MIKDKEARKEYNRKWIAKRRQEWIDEQGGKCVLCGSTTNLEVDHIDPSLKLYKPSDLWSLSKTNPRRIAELNKCRVLCAVCHQTKTSKEQMTTEHGDAMYHGPLKCKCVVCKAGHKQHNAKWRNRK